MPLKVGVWSCVLKCGSQMGRMTSPGRQAQAAGVNLDCGCRPCASGPVDKKAW